MNLVLMLAVLGIILGAAYYLRSKGVSIPGLSNDKVSTIDWQDRARTGGTGYSPPRVRGSEGSLVVPPSKGPAVVSRSGKGHF